MQNCLRPCGLSICAFLVAISCACAPAPTPIPAVSVTVTPIAPTSIQPTSVSVDWATFRYEPFALTLRYPKDWYPHTIQETSGTIIKLSYPVDNPSTQTWASGEKVNIQIWQVQLQKGGSFDDWVRSQVSQKGSVLKDAKQHPIIVADIPGVEFTSAAAPFLQVAVPVQNLVYNFRFGTNPTATTQGDNLALASTFSQILSTIKFDAAGLAKLANVTPIRPTVPPQWTPELLRPQLPASMLTPSGTGPTMATTPIPRSPTPASLPTSGASTSMQPPTISDVVAEDDFSANRGWPVWKDGGADGEIVNGRYRFGVRVPGIVVWRTNPNLRVSDFYLKVDSYPLTQSEAVYSYGILFRYQNQGYAFGLSNHGEYEFGKLPGDGSAKYREWTFSSAIHTNSLNVIEVIAVDGKTQLFVNGTKIDEFSDGAFSTGLIGFYVSTFGGGKEAVAEFDNLVIKRK